jgi:hypothetical protein
LSKKYFVRTALQSRPHIFVAALAAPRNPRLAFYFGGEEIEELGFGSEEA